jgi:hypothetical protein
LSEKKKKHGNKVVSSWPWQVFAPKAGRAVSY